MEHHSHIKCTSLVRIQNPNDRWCLARAVDIGLAHRKSLKPGSGGKAWFKAQCIQQYARAERARRIMQEAGIPLNLQFYTLEHVDAIQQRLNQLVGGEGKIRLVVFKKESQYRIVYKGEGRAARFNLCLLLEGDHFSYIGRPEQLFKAHRYCIDCERTATRYRHWAGCKVIFFLYFLLCFFMIF